MLGVITQASRVPRCLVGPPGLALSYLHLTTCGGLSPLSLPTRYIERGNSAAPGSYHFTWDPTTAVLTGASCCRGQSPMYLLIIDPTTAVGAANWRWRSDSNSRGQIPMNLLTIDPTTAGRLGAPYWRRRSDSNSRGQRRPNFADYCATKGWTDCTRFSKFYVLKTCVQVDLLYSSTAVIVVV